MQSKWVRLVALSVSAFCMALAGCRPPDTDPPPDTILPIVRASVGAAGTQGNGQSWTPSINSDGRYAAFYSYATNLAGPDTNGSADVFVFDRQDGAVVLVSVDSSGAQGNGESIDPAISADGRYVAFMSIATNLVLSDTNLTSDIFVYDRRDGAVERISVDATGTQANGDSMHPAISADGRYAAFDSDAANLVGSDTNGVTDVFVRDRQTGAVELVSVASAGTQGDDQSWDPSISSDGRYVAFVSNARNLAPPDANNSNDVFVYDRQTGALELVSVDSVGARGNSNSFGPSISSDGRCVAFMSYASNLVPGDTNGTVDVFVYDRQADVIERVSVDADGTQGNGESRNPSISSDGRYVAFDSRATNLVPGDTNGDEDVFVYDRQADAIRRASVDSAGAQGNDKCMEPSISADGRYMAFMSSATNLVPGDSNGFGDIFIAPAQ